MGRNKLEVWLFFLSLISWLFWLCGVLLLPLRHTTWPMVSLTYGVAFLLSLTIVIVYEIADRHRADLRRGYAISASIVMILCIFCSVLG